MQFVCKDTFFLRNAQGMVEKLYLCIQETNYIKEQYEEKSVDSMCLSGLNDGLGTIQGVFHKGDDARVISKDL